MQKKNFLNTIFKEIKKDNLEQFTLLLSNNNTIYFKNKQKENFLFYALQSGSLKISQYLIEKYPEFLLERNAYLLTPFSDVIYRDNNKGFKAFLKLSQISNVSFNEVYHKGGEVYSIPLLAVERLTKNNWHIFEQITKSFWDEKSLIAIDNSGYNIAHKIAINNAYYAISILDYLPASLFHHTDSELGASPFLTSLKFSELPLIKKLLTYSNIKQETVLGSNAVHLSIFNNDIEVLKFILKELKDSPELITTSNIYGDSPLMSAINSHNIEALSLLIPYHIEQEKDLTEEIIHFIKTSPKNFDKFKLFIHNIKPENLKNLSHNEEYLTIFFSYIFYNGLESDLEDLKKTFFWNDIFKIQSTFLQHQLYSSSVLGKKAIKYKINYLLESKQFLTSSESQLFFTPKKDIDLYFSNPDYRYFNKNTKIASFVSVLNTMPGNQIIDLINKTNFLEKTDSLDKIHLFSIALKKKNKTLLDLIRLPKENLLLKGSLNTALMIQDLLPEYEYDEKFQEHFNHILSQFNFKPIRLFHHYIDKIFSLESDEKMSKIYNVLSLLKDFPDYKKDFIHLLIYRLTQTQEDQSDLLSLFIKNDKAVLSAIENISPKHINKLKNNEFTQHILSVYGERKNLIDLLVVIAQSKNIYKHDLMQFILPKCILNSSTAKRLAKQIRENPIDDYGWSFIIKNFMNNKSFPILIDVYFSSKNSFNDFSKDILDMLPQFSHSNKEYIYQYFQYFDFNNKEINILNSLSKNLTLDNKKIVQDCFQHYNFKPIYYLIEYKDLNINELNLSSFWENFKINDFFIDLQNKDKLNSEPINNYFEFLKSHKNHLSKESINLILESFVTWLKINDTKENNIAMIRTINIFFNIFQEKINILNDKKIIDICEVIIANNDLNNLTSAQQEYDEVLTTIFSNKEYNEIFFKEINDNEFLQKNNDKFPQEQQKRLQFYFLKQKFSSSVQKQVKSHKI